MGRKKSYIKRMVRMNGYDPKMMASCYGKIRYTKEAAQERADWYETMNAYDCHFCKYWHVGRKKGAFDGQPD